MARSLIASLDTSVLAAIFSLVTRLDEPVLCDFDYEPKLADVRIRANVILHKTHVPKIFFHIQQLNREMLKRGKCREMQK